MRTLLTALLIALAPMAPAQLQAQTQAETLMTDDFTQSPQDRWRFFTDGVMGGKSEGQVAFQTEGGTTFARMTGQVSTANNGGFIQMRRDLSLAAPEAATGIRLIARGNGQRYFVHLRSKATNRPWQYYQAGFEVTEDWTEYRLPFSDFDPAGGVSRDMPQPDALTSVAVAAFGRDYAAEIEVKEIGVY